MSGKLELDADQFFVFDLFCHDERIFCVTGKESGKTLVLPPLTGYLQELPESDFKERKFG